MQIDVRTSIHRFKKPLIWSGVVFAALVLLSVVALPPLVKSRVIKKLSVALHREVSIQQIRFNPFTALQAFVWAPFSFLPLVRGGEEG